MKQTLEELIKQIELSNERFEKATPAQKRVMIAQDTIARIHTDNLKPETGILIVSHQHSLAEKHSSFKEFINEAQECNVCAKGALLCSFVGRVNQMDTTTVLNKISSSGELITQVEIDLRDEFHKKLLELFTASQLDLIETAFEGSSFLNVIDSIQANEAENFHYDYDEDDQRLIAICQNIIDNNGEFIP